MICYIVLLFPVVFCGNPDGSVNFHSVTVDVPADDEPVGPSFRKQRVVPEERYAVPGFPDVEGPGCDHLRSIVFRTALGLALLSLVALVIVSHTV
jgi:hypothetical protein